VIPECRPSAGNKTFTVVAVYDSRFENPWLLAYPFQLSGADFWGCYQDRWPIEQLPLAAKRVVGAHRQFVFDKQSCYHLPELSSLTGSMLTYLAATLPPIPTGLWVRQSIYRSLDSSHKCNDEALKAACTSLIGLIFELFLKSFNVLPAP
jgi:hypothetical protein